MGIIDERDKLHCRDIKGGREGEMRWRCFGRDASLSATRKMSAAAEAETGLSVAADALTNCPYKLNPVESETANPRFRDS